MTDGLFGIVVLGLVIVKGKTDPAIFCPCDDCVRSAVKAYCAVMDEAEG